MEFFCFSHALVNKLGEKGWVDHELAPLCVVSRRRFSRHRLFQRSACFFQCRDIMRIATNMSRNSFSSALLLTGLPCPGMIMVFSVAAAKLASDAAIMPSMLPPVE